MQPVTQGEIKSDEYECIDGRHAWPEGSNGEVCQRHCDGVDDDGDSKCHVLAPLTFWAVNENVFARMWRSRSFEVHRPGNARIRNPRHVWLSGHLRSRYGCAP